MGISGITNPEIPMFMASYKHHADEILTPMVLSER